jgi:hypothetical protein
MLAKDRQIRPRWDECSSGGLLRRAGYAGGGGVSFEPPSAFRGAARVFQLFCSNWASGPARLERANPQIRSLALNTTASGFAC